MNENISKRQELLVLLKDNPLTAKELSEQLEIPIEHVRTYISQFSEEGKIIKSGKEGRYNLYETVDVNIIEILKNGILELNLLMDTIKPVIPSNIDKNKIKEAIELCHTI